MAVELKLSVFKDEGLGKYIAELSIEGPQGKAVDRCGAGDTKAEAAANAADNLAITRDRLDGLVNSIPAPHYDDAVSTIKQLNAIINKLRA